MVLRRAFPVLLVLLTIGAGAPASAAEEDEDDPKPQTPPTGVSTGPPIRYTLPPAHARDLRACSSRTPICVHADSAEEGKTALDVLAAFERAWTMLTGALALPAPDLDPDTLAYDVHLVAEDAAFPELVATHLASRDVRSRIDRGGAFTVVDRRMRAGCMLDALAAKSIARAILFRVAPSTEDGSAHGQTAYLARLVVPCAAALALDSTKTFQGLPERSFCDAHAPDDTKAPPGWGPMPATRASLLFAEGGSLFWERIDWAFGRSPGILVAATWALHPTRTPSPSPRWVNEHDTFDVLRVSFKDALSRGSTIHDLMLDFGVARAFFGSADDGLHAPETRVLGDAAKVPLDWDIPWPTKPRRLQPRAAVYPMGSSYVMISRKDARPGSRLRVEIDWEEHALFRWALVKLDARGTELGRVPIASQERATRAQMTLVELDNVDRVLIVGVNVGDPTYAFDPDDEVWEPHGWLLTLAEE